MGKLIAILAASAAVAGGATFAVFHHLDPNNCPLSGCKTAQVRCCDTPTEAAASPAEMTVAAAGPVALFTEGTVPVSTDAKPAGCPACAARAAAACCTDGATSRPTSVAAVVGPAAAVR
ncbi:hypothetical protein [Urbifossiella limnaea]|uniref:Uncharacterized protein n=1 Tax=Urbifossiella limnaea TaxID=2528023 RepID=A0A517Y070_9BACT|nr:hypothetical protein [Urbifossiella limnaea]QDU23154.1 hypothetical protein ETAA1_51460 [Urbifossiella limnaea]